ncbi:MAG: gliding motility-associated C-terminal domain-containing protein, partial [Bacteroidia bacterium]
YLWNDGSTLDSLQNISAGTYTVTVTDSLGCTALASVTLVSQSSQITVSMTASVNPVCFGDSNGNAIPQISGGIAPFIYLWNDGSTNDSLQNISAGTYTVTVTDSLGCSSQASVTFISQSSQISVSMTASIGPACFGDSTGNAIPQVSGGISPFTYLWNDGSTVDSLQNISAGTYTVTVTDSLGCTAQAIVTLASQSSQISISFIGNTPLCFGDLGNIVAQIAGGVAPFNYLWSDGSTTNSLQNISAGTYTVTVTDSLGCSSQATVILASQSSQINISGNITNANCVTSSAGAISTNVSGGAGAYSYLWSNGSTIANLSALSPGNYTLQITDSLGCTASQTFIVTDTGTAITVIASGSTEFCEGQSVTLSVMLINGATYQWYNTGILINGATSDSLNVNTSGNYSVSVTTTLCGINITSDVTVTVNALPQVDAGNDALICTDSIVQLNATGSGFPSWIPTATLNNSNSFTPLASPVQTTLYIITVTDVNGCINSDSVLVTVTNDGCDSLRVPNGFSPDGDNNNDNFVIPGIGNYPNNTLRIYNRWGNLVYKSDGYKNTWDGIANAGGVIIGEKVPVGTYFYVLDLGNGSKATASYLVIKY